MGGTALGASGRSNNGLKLDVKTGKLSLWRLFPTFTFTFYACCTWQPSIPQLTHPSIESSRLRMMHTPYVLCWRFVAASPFHSHVLKRRSRQGSRCTHCAHPFIVYPIDRWACQRVALRLGLDTLCYSHPAMIGRVSRLWAGGTRDQGASREGVDHGAPSPWLRPPSPQLSVPGSPLLAAAKKGLL